MKNGQATNLEQEAKRKELESFLKDLSELEKKRGIKVVAVMDRNIFGTTARLDYMDYKQFEAMIAQIKN